MHVCRCIMALHGSVMMEWLACAVQKWGNGSHLQSVARWKQNKESAAGPISPSQVRPATSTCGV